MTLDVMRPSSENSEFLIEVLVDEGEQRDGRKKDIRDERVDDACKCRRDTESLLEHVQM